MTSLLKLIYKPFIYMILLLLMTLSLLLLQERKLFDVRTLVQIDPIPHTIELIEKKKYAKAEEYLGYFMEYSYVYDKPKSKKILQEIRAKRESYAYQSDKFMEGLLKGKSDEDIGQASAIASDFLIIGDIRDLSIEGSRYYNDKEVDKVVIALSSLGLMTSISTVYTLGATAPLKTSISVLKYAKRANKIPTWLSNQLLKEANIAKNSYSVKHIEKLLKPIYTLYKKIGLTQTLELLQNTKSLNELKSMMNLSSKFGKKTSTLIQITNHKLLSYHKNLQNISPKNILYASTYGENGLKGISKMGEKKFILRMGNRVNLLKTGYKGNLNALFNYLLQHIPSWLLFSISFLGLLYFIKEFYMVSKRLIP